MSELYDDGLRVEICPSCGSKLIECEDNDGVWYQCPNHECLELFDADEIEGDGK